MNSGTAAACAVHTAGSRTNRRGPWEIHIRWRPPCLGLGGNLLSREISRAQITGSRPPAAGLRRAAGLVQSDHSSAHHPRCGVRFMASLGAIAT